MRTLTLSRISLALIAAVALITAPSAVKAQTSDTEVAANIPFTFQVGSSHYAAGIYTLQLMRHVLTIQGRSASGMMEVFPESTNHPPATSVLVFHRYGDHYFLSELHFGGSPEFVKSPVSRAERRIRLEEEASNHGTGNTSANVEVALLVSPR